MIGMQRFYRWVILHSSLYRSVMGVQRFYRWVRLHTYLSKYLYSKALCRRLQDVIWGQGVALVRFLPSMQDVLNLIPAPIEYMVKPGRHRLWNKIDLSLDSRPIMSNGPWQDILSEFPPL